MSPRGRTSRRWDSASCLRNTSRVSRLYIAKLNRLILAGLRRDFALGTQIELGRLHPPNSFTRRLQVKILRALIPTVLIGSAALTLSTQVLAADATAGGTFEVPSRTISLKDLDLGEPGHLPIMYARVQQAALAVCDSTVRAERRLHRRVPAGWRDQCVRSAVDEAVRSVDDQRLTALHSRNSGLMADEK